MNKLMKFYENDTDVMHYLGEDLQSYVSIPKNLGHNIKVFMFFGDLMLPEDKRTELLTTMLNTSKVVNNGNSNGVIITSLMSSDFFMNGNVVSYGKESIRIKKVVNTVYNQMLREKIAEKGDFVKQIEIINQDNKYKDFSDWLCRQVPSKFKQVNYQELITKKEPYSHVFVNQNDASIFNEPNEQSVLFKSNIRPNHEELYIGTPSYEQINQKKLVKRYPSDNNSAFISWYTTIFILISSLVIGVIISITLIK